MTLKTILTAFRDGLYLGRSQRRISPTSTVPIERPPPRQSVEPISRSNPQTEVVALLNLIMRDYGLYLYCDIDTEGHVVVHLDASDPYLPQLKAKIIRFMRHGKHVPTNIRIETEERDGCHRMPHETLEHYEEFLHQYLGLRFTSWKMVFKYEGDAFVTILLDDSSSSSVAEALFLASVFDENDHVQIAFSDDE
jgi:hypothetical protein